MRAHVTCGRGTEVFVRAELLDKLRCTVSSVEDGKVFFALADLPEWPYPHSQHEQVFSLKTVERIFATVTHFPTADIKGNGKVKFLHALKNRILNDRNLKEAVKSTHKLRLARKTHTEQSTLNYGHESTEPPNTGTPHESPVHTGHDPHSDELSTTSRTDTVSCSDQATNSVADTVSCSDQATNSVADTVSCSDQATNSVAKNGHCDERSRNPPLRQDVSVKELPPELRPSLPINSRNAFVEDCHTEQNRTTNNRACKRTKGQEADLAAGACRDDCMPDPPAKLRRCDSVPTSVDDEDGHEEGMCVRRAAEKLSSVPDGQTGGETAVSFRFSVKCGGWCRKWLQPQRLAKELGIRLTIMTGWTSDLSSHDIEICVHANDDFVTVGIPLTRIPLSKRDYIHTAGLRSTISWIMARQADIQPGHRVLDPMCGKATILVEAAKEHPQLTGFLGCDLDPHQLQAADRNVKQARLCASVQLLQADVLNLPLKSGCVDRIVCDAPFGNKFTVASGTLPQFYRKMMQEMHRLLAADGLAVLLTSQELLPMVQGNCHDASAGPEPFLPVDKTSAPCENDDGLDGSQKSVRGGVDVISSPTSVRGGDDVISSPTSVRGGDDVISSSPTAASATESLQGAEELQRIKACASSCLQTTGGERNSTDFAPRSSVCGRLLKTMGERSSHADDCTAKRSLSAQEATPSQTSDCTNEFGGETSAALGTQNGRFSLLSKHYVKLGETYAYIVVLQK